MKKKIDPRQGEYSEVRDDDEWLMRDTPGGARGWGADDGHMDMVNFVPADWALILWKTDGHRENWLYRADFYSEEWSNTPKKKRWPNDLGRPPADHPIALMIRERIDELDARFNKLGSVKKR